MEPAGVRAIWSGVEDLYRSGIHPANSFCLRWQGKVVLKRAIGHARGNGPDDGPGVEKILATPDTPIFLFSASKVAAAMLIHLLDERGRIHLMDPVSHAVMETGKPEIDRTVMLPMRYGAGMILGNKPVGMYGPFTHAAYGHLGFSNIFCWADPERDIAVSLLTTGKALFGPHILPLARLLARISRHCKGAPGDFV